MKYSFCYTVKNRTSYTNIFDNKTIQMNLFEKSINSIINSFDNQDDFEIIITDFKSDDTDFNFIKNKIKNYDILTIDEPYFNRGKGLNLSRTKTNGDYIFFIDVDMLISKELIKQTNIVLEKYDAFFPICYSYLNPNKKNGYWRTLGYGNCIIKKHIGNVKWVENESWGKEDINYYSRLQKKYNVYRENGNKFYHLWHNNDLSFKNKHYKNKINNVKIENTVFDFFDKIYCVNLDGRPDKWEKVQKTFKKLQLNVTRISGVICENPRSNHTINGALGLSKSILKILKDAKINKYKRVLIFEDDVLFFYKYNINQLVNNSIKELPSDWETLSLGGNIIEKTTKYSDNLSIINGCWGTQSWGVNCNYYDELIEFLENDDLLFQRPQLDSILYKGLNNKKHFVVKPLLTTQYVGYSDISKSINNSTLTQKSNEKKNLI